MAAAIAQLIVSASLIVCAAIVLARCRNVIAKRTPPGRLWRDGISSPGGVT